MTKKKKAVEEVQEIIADANKKFAYLTYLKNKASELEKIKGISLETKKGFIKSVSFSTNMIDESRTTDNEYCIRISYSEYYIYMFQKIILHG